MIKNIGKIELDHLTKSFTEYVNHRITILYQHYYIKHRFYMHISKNDSQFYLAGRGVGIWKNRQRLINSKKV